MPSTNPLLPAGFDVMFYSFVLVVVLLAAYALYQLLRNRAKMSNFEWGAWFVIILVLPVLGSLFFLLLKKKTQHSTERENSSGV